MVDSGEGSWVWVIRGVAQKPSVGEGRSVGVGRRLVSSRPGASLEWASLEWVTLDIVWIDQAQSEDTQDMVHRIGLFGSDLALLDSLTGLRCGQREWL